MINYLKNDTSLTQDDVFTKESSVNRRSPAVNDSYPECRTRYSFHAEFDGCLTVQKGQILFLQRHNNDGWSLGIGFESTMRKTLPATSNEKCSKFQIHKKVKTLDSQTGFVPTDYLDVQS